jgi:hypothetical protein
MANKASNTATTDPAVEAEVMETQSLLERVFNQEDSANAGWHKHLMTLTPSEVSDLLAEYEAGSFKINDQYMEQFFLLAARSVQRRQADLFSEGQSATIGPVYIERSVGGNAALGFGFQSATEAGEIQRTGVGIYVRCDHLIGAKNPIPGLKL